MATVKTNDGRSFEVKEVTPSGLMSIMEACGRFVPSEGWMRYAILICSVTEIDGVPVPKPITKQQIENLGDKIGNDGLVALSEHFYPTAGTDEADGEVEAAKN